MLGDMHTDFTMLSIYRESHDLQANYYLTEKQDTLGDKLVSLRKAMRHAIIAWTCHEKKASALIIRIAEAFLYATSSNLNENPRCKKLEDLTEFKWLHEALESAPLLSQQSQIEALITRIIHLIDTHRLHRLSGTDELAKLAKDNTELKIVNAELKARVLKVENENVDLKTRMDNLEEKLAQLMQRVTTQVDTTTPAVEKEQKNSPRFYS